MSEPKLERLRRLGMLNPNPRQIKAPWFLSGEFFDPNDMVQAKYEMLRHVQVDGVSKAEAAALFGMSRPTFYQAEAAFAREGLAGLLPRSRGPKGAYKLTPEVMAFIEERLPSDGEMHARSLAQQIEAELGLSIHPRSIERAITHKKKPNRQCVDCASSLVHQNLRGSACEHSCQTISTRGTGRIALPRNVHWVRDPAQNKGHTCGHAQFIQLAIIPRQQRDRSIIGKFHVAYFFGAHTCLLIDFRK
jgi:transposase